MKVFITGSTGLLGSTLLRLAPPRVVLGASYNVNLLVPNIKCQYYKVDITDNTLVDNAISDFKPDFVIHTAAIATPDYCDKHIEEAQKVNVVGTKNILEACRKVGSVMVYVTTNGIYDGERAPYDERAMPSPIDIYGKTKLEAENYVISSGVAHIIFRLMTMYGWNNPRERQNPLTWLLDILGKNKTPVHMVTDMYNNFLSVEEAARAIWKGILLNETGEKYNIAGANCINRYSFSKEIAEVFGLDSSMIYPVTLDFFKNFVPRPKNTCFITTKMQDVLGLQPLSTLEGLRYFKYHTLSESAWKNL